MARNLDFTFPCFDCEATNFVNIPSEVDEEEYEEDGDMIFNVTSCVVCNKENMLSFILEKGAWRLCAAQKAHSIGEESLLDN